MRNLSLLSIFSFKTVVITSLLYGALVSSQANADAIPFNYFKCKYYGDPSDQSCGYNRDLKTMMEAHNIVSEQARKLQQVDFTLMNFSPDAAAPTSGMMSTNGTVIVATAKSYFDAASMRIGEQLASSDLDPNQKKSISDSLTKMEDNFKIQIKQYEKFVESHKTAVANHEATYGSTNPNLPYTPPAASGGGVGSTVGDFLKKNGTTIGIAAVAAGGLAMYLNKKDKKAASQQAAAASSAATTTTSTTSTTASTNLNAPTTASTQVQQLSQVPTEQTSPLSASANATANDPAYTGVGSALGDTSGARDSSAGTFLTTFGCLEGESDSVCRTRLACTATEAMSTCQARWNSGVISVAAAQ